MQEHMVIIDCLIQKDISPSPECIKRDGQKVTIGALNISVVSYDTNCAENKTDKHSKSGISAI